MVNINNGLQNVHISGSDSDFITAEILDAFEEELRLKIEELYQSDFVFSHDPRAEYCAHCNA